MCTEVISKIHIVVSFEETIQEILLGSCTLQMYHQLDFDYHDHTVPEIISWPIILGDSLVWVYISLL